MPLEEIKYFLDYVVAPQPPRLRSIPDITGGADP
jgi:hypothetical protein